MNGAVLGLVLLTFVGGVSALAALVVAILRRRIQWGSEGARVIFDEGEEGQVEEPAAESAGVAAALARAVDRKGERTPQREGRSRGDVEARRLADVSSREPVLAFLRWAIVWLVVGSILGLTASLKLTFPDWLASSAALTFGRIRPLHLNLVAYGWGSMAAVAVALWMIPRLAKRPLVYPRVAVWGFRFWNAGMVLGALAITFAWTDGLEWLEFPWPIDIFLVVGGGMAGVPILATLLTSKVPHTYVSSWYLGAAFLWFPILFVVANVPYVHFGVEHATVNWWFAHNVLGLWLTPIGLALAYYFIPKVLGRPIHSYALSMVGFWSLAFFYSQVGTHHLIGGPVPTWLVTLAIVHSVMMLVPVISVAINHHTTMIGRFGALRHSPTLRFVVLGAMMYTLTSIEGSFEALRSVNRVTHFTHFTVAHAHFGVYGFVSFELFGAIYFLLPRLIEREWPYPGLVRVHFWSSFIGIVVYVVGMSIGGVLQGLAMLDPQQGFLESMRVTIPWLHSRSVGGTLMTVGHLAFAAHVYVMVKGRGPARAAAPWAEPAPSSAEVAS
jgi:cytochrome c oxidase cbb3-type subunit 1